MRGGDPSSPAATASEVTTQATTVLGPRDFGYVNNGLEATLRVERSTGTVVFKNGRATSVGKPAVYRLDLKGVRVDAALRGARALAPGTSQTLSVRFPPTADIATATFFGLELGGVHAGGFTDRSARRGASSAPEASTRPGAAQTRSATATGSPMRTAVAL